MLFIDHYNHVYTYLRLRILARIYSCLTRRYFEFSRNCQKSYLSSRPIIWGSNQVFITFRSKVITPQGYISKNAVFFTFRPNSANFLKIESGRNYQMLIYTPRPFICAHSHVHLLHRNNLSCPGKPHVSKNRCFRKVRPYAGNRNLAETANGHIYTQKPLIWAYSQVSTTIRYTETAWKSSCFEIPLFSVWGMFG